MIRHGDDIDSPWGVIVIPQSDSELMGCHNDNPFIHNSFSLC